ncbi:MAG TPA: methyltransferase domain-containing protein [Candidatus Peribacteraceae bacterium]|nr:methyltransferase domain-containing protein [Candidatus Peribacteraceae bacterium]
MEQWSHGSIVQLLHCSILVISMKLVTNSQARIGLHQALAEVELNGSVLDIGGTKGGKYLACLKGNNTVTTVNIDEKYGYDLKFDVEKPFPLADASYDHVICINLLEHIYNDKNVIQESFRVLRPGGTMINVTPFLIAVHGCPNDFRRYTDEALRRMFQDAGFIVDEVKPIAYGCFHTVYQLTFVLVPLKPIRELYRWLCVGLDRLLMALSKKYTEHTKNFALGYIVRARKP